MNKPSNLSPQQAIRAKCIECIGGELAEIRNCTARTPVLSPITHCDPKGCFLWPYRMGHGKDLSRGAVKNSKLKAIRKECLNCMGGSSGFVKDCESFNCALWPFRLGKNPNLIGKRKNNLPNRTVMNQKSAQNPRSPVEPIERILPPTRKANSRAYFGSK